LLFEVFLADFEDPEEHSQVFERKAVLGGQVFVVFAGVEAGVQLGQHFAELYVVELFTFE